MGAKGLMFRHIRNFSHLVRIARTFARNDALFPVEALKIPTLTFIARLLRKKSDLPPGIRLANAFTTLGPTFIKLGQALSTRSDLVGENISEDLTHLRDQLPPFSKEVAIDIIESELEGKISELYLEFDEEPAAAASIAQVHFAKMKNGEEVAVKILRPKIRRIIERDLELLKWIGGIIEKRNPSYAKRIKPHEVIETLQETVRLELDLRMEAASASKLRQNFENYDGFYVPQIFWQNTSERVLTIEKVEGIKVDDREALEKAGHNPDEILRVSSQALFKQVFDDGFFHADLHPGNVFINPRGEIVPIDFGIMGWIDEASRMYVAEIVAGFLTRDYNRVADAHFDAGYVPATKNRDSFALACRAVGEPIMDLPINEISVARLLAQMFKVAEDFEMETQPHLLLLQKTMMMAEGVGRSLNPNVNMWKLAEPLVEEWVKSNFGVKAQAEKVARHARKLFFKVPAIINKIDEYLEKELEKDGSNKK